MKSSIQALEFNEIIHILQKYTITYLGREKISKLIPSYAYEEVSHLLQETEQFFQFLYRKGNPPLYEIEDISLALKILRSHSSLSAKLLLDIGNIFKIARELREYFYKDETISIEDFPLLDVYFQKLYTNKNLENIIFSSILDENTIDDNASKTLANLRRKRRNLENEIRDVLNKSLHIYSKYIMEPIITIRNDRYVIPVKESYKNEVKGLFHDISASGSTVFIEPMSVFELNNQINSLKTEESLEIERILQDISSQLFPYIQDLSTTVEYIGNIDAIFAKAKYAKEIDGIFPTLNKEKQIHLLRARHPLIAQENVVPIDLHIGENYSSLIITGPNTGGKTVTLKTVGLLTLMACAGMAIPAQENSSIHVFDSVFASIGDEQSITESLSTFSSHMTNIIDILTHSSENSLILLDELGSGTSPLEGASLAISILEFFYQQGCITISTTHYEEVKQYALITNGFENACSEFDVENLKPTYRLLIGIPGKSYAFAISQRLGLPNSILERAKDFIQQDSIDFENLLKKIYDNQIAIEQEKEEIEKNLHQITLLRKELEKEREKLQISHAEQLDKAKKDARDILLEAKEEARILLKELNTAYINNDAKKANQIQEKLNHHIKDLYPKTSTTSPSYFTKNMLHVGDLIEISGFSQPATILSLSGKENQLQVQIGSMKMQILVENIKKVLPIPNKNTVSSATHVPSFNQKTKQISSEINVIGQTIEEARFVIDKYIDDCYLAKLQTVRIVHGKGTGKLREGIHQFLRKNPHVQSFRLGTFGEGEMGVTVVTLKK